MSDDKTPDQWRDRVLAAYAAADAGPLKADLDNAPLMECWQVLRSEKGNLTLCGMGSGHPELPDAFIATSQLIALNPMEDWARTVSRWYRLGTSFKDAVALPNKSELLVAQIRGIRIKIKTSPYFNPIDDMSKIATIMSRYRKRMQER